MAAFRTVVRAQPGSRRAVRCRAHSLSFWMKSLRSPRTSHHSWKTSWRVPLKNLTLPRCWNNQQPFQTDWHWSDINDQTDCSLGILLQTETKQEKHTDYCSTLGLVHLLSGPHFFWNPWTSSSSIPPDSETFLVLHKSGSKQLLHSKYCFLAGQLWSRDRSWYG